MMTDKIANLFISHLVELSASRAVELLRDELQQAESEIATPPGPTAAEMVEAERRHATNGEHPPDHHLRSEQVDPGAWRDSLEGRVRPEHASAEPVPTPPPTTEVSVAAHALVEHLRARAAAQGTTNTPWRTLERGLLVDLQGACARQGLEHLRMQRDIEYLKAQLEQAHGEPRSAWDDTPVDTTAGTALEKLSESLRASAARAGREQAPQRTAEVALVLQLRDAVAAQAKARHALQLEVARMRTEAHSLSLVLKQAHIRAHDAELQLEEEAESPGKILRPDDEPERTRADLLEEIKTGRQNTEDEFTRHTKTKTDAEVMYTEAHSLSLVALGVLKDFFRVGGIAIEDGQRMAYPINTELYMRFRKVAQLAENMRVTADRLPWVRK